LGFKRWEKSEFQKCKHDIKTGGGEALVEKFKKGVGN